MNWIIMNYDKLHLAAWAVAIAALAFIAPV